MTKVIDLDISTKFTHIAGNAFGVNVYNEQIKDKYKDGDMIEIWFPKHIEGVSISFVQGLISEMVKASDKAKVLKNVKLKSNDPFLNNRLDENLKF